MFTDRSETFRMPAEPPTVVSKGTFALWSSSLLAGNIHPSSPTATVCCL